MSDDPQDRPTAESRRTTTTTTSTTSGPRKTTVREYIFQEWNNPSSVLLAIAGAVLIILVIVLLIPVIRRAFTGPESTTPSSAMGPILSAATEVSKGPNAAATESIPAVPAPIAPPPAGPSPTFSGFYQQHGGVQVLGLPISDEITVGGRKVQWFERARLEQWPEFAGTPYEIQLGRLGEELVQGRKFQEQAAFVSRPDLVFFTQTGHAVGEPFLSFWSQNGGLDVFGYPLSAPVPEQLPDGRVHTVQYFERARFELHPETPDYPVQLGLLGRALYAKNRAPGTVATPMIITVPGPTPVPMP